MNYGGNSVNILSDGTLMVDGGYAFGQLASMFEKKKTQPTKSIEPYMCWSG